MRTSIEFSDNILTVETFEDLGNAIDDLDVGRLEFSEPIRKVIIKNINRNLEKYEVQDYLFSSQLKELEAVDIIDSGKGLCSDDGLVYTADFKYLVFCPIGRRGTVKIHEGTEMLLQIIGKYKITEKVTTFAPTRNIFFKTGEQRAVCNNPPLAVGLGKAFHLLTENGKPADKKSSAGQRLRF